MRSSGTLRWIRVTFIARCRAPSGSWGTGAQPAHRAAGRPSCTGAVTPTSCIRLCSGLGSARPASQCGSRPAARSTCLPMSGSAGGLTRARSPAQPWRTMMSAQMPRFRPILDQFAPYKPGKPPAATSGPMYKLSSNESPFGPLPSVVKVIAEAAGQVNRYPDNGAAELTEAIAARHAVPAAHIAIGCGSVGLVQQLLEAVADPGAEVLYAWRSFEAYPYLADLAGATSVRVPLTDERHDLDAMAAAITDATRLIFVCTPNNPTGTIVTSGELARFLDRVPRDCLVVLDEAYAEYVRDPDVPDGIEIYKERPNVAVLRTFSKAYGLAGLRVGFLVGH